MTAAAAASFGARVDGVGGEAACGLDSTEHASAPVLVGALHGGLASRASCAAKRPEAIALEIGEGLATPPGDEILVNGGLAGGVQAQHPETLDEESGD